MYPGRVYLGRVSGVCFFFGTGYCFLFLNRFFRSWKDFRVWGGGALGFFRGVDCRVWGGHRLSRVGP